MLPPPLSAQYPAHDRTPQACAQSGALAPNGRRGGRGDGTVKRAAPARRLAASGEATNGAQAAQRTIDGPKSRHGGACPEWQILAGSGASSGISTMHGGRFRSRPHAEQLRCEKSSHNWIRRDVGCEAVPLLNIFVLKPIRRAFTARPAAGRATSSVCVARRVHGAVPTGERRKRHRLPCQLQHHSVFGDSGSIPAGRGVRPSVTDSSFFMNGVQGRD